MRCAIGSGSFRTCESAASRTVTDFLVARSCSVIVFAEVSIEEIVPAMFRNVPATISAAVNSVPSALRVPRARSWSPALICSSFAGFASSNLIESGAYRRTTVSLER